MFASSFHPSSLTSSGRIYLRLDNQRDGVHAFPITRMWKEVLGSVDAVFSYSDKMYFIKVHFPTCSDIKTIKAVYKSLKF